MSATLPDRHRKAPPGKAGTGWQGGRPRSPWLWISEEGKQGVAVFLQPSQVASDFLQRVRAVRGSELGPGRQVERVPMEGLQCQPGSPLESRIERPCVSSQAPGQPGSGLHSAWRDSSWHQLQSGTMHGFLSFFFFSLKKIVFLIEGREGPEPLIEQLSIVEASGTVCP